MKYFATLNGEALKAKCELVLMPLADWKRYAKSKGCRYRKLGGDHTFTDENENVFILKQAFEVRMDSPDMFRASLNIS